jgi:uncharacterized Zn finger protein (UPF0148 family)
MKRYAIALSLMLVFATAALARVGGGHSYSGGSHSGSSHSSSSSHSYGGGGSYRSSGGGSADVSCGTVFFIIVFIFIFLIVASRFQGNAAVYQASAGGWQQMSDPFAGLVKHDPNFSRAVFDDFCYALYAKAHHARATGDLDRYTPFLSENVRKIMAARTPGLSEVRAVVIGAMTVKEVRGLDQPLVTAIVEYESNVTEVVNGSEMSWYLREQWQFQRKRDILSPPPAKAKAEHCPRCGAPLQTRSDGGCAYCGVRIADGSFQWYATALKVLSKEARGPLLTSDVEEEGTDLPTVRVGFEKQWKDFVAIHPTFQWDAFEKLVRKTATELQRAWTAREWERIRPFETDNLFQMHRYWIDAYLKQRLRNVVDDYQISRVEAVKIKSDAFYDAFTVRMFASGRDYTVDDQGKVVGGSRDSVRSWSEYWTFIRTRGSEAVPSASVSCPNCGATVAVGATGICQHCGGKLTTGDFGWILSRIDQDEAYQG